MKNQQKDPRDNNAVVSVVFFILGIIIIIGFSLFFGRCETKKADFNLGNRLFRSFIFPLSKFEIKIRQRIVP